MDAGQYNEQTQVRYINKLTVSANSIQLFRLSRKSTGCGRLTAQVRAAALSSGVKDVIHAAVYAGPGDDIEARGVCVNCFANA